MSDGLTACQTDIDGGGWTLVSAVKDAAVDADGCPGGWQLVDERSDRDFIGRHREQVASRQLSAVFPAPIAWRSVIGRITGIAFGEQDAFESTGSTTIDQIYVDGISVTTAPSGGARQHIFTFLSGHPADQASGRCPCVGGRVQPAFVGDNSFATGRAS